eukprot:1147595-Pelagomonas_calceolata.AAC.10
MEGSHVGIENPYFYHLPVASILCLFVDLRVEVHVMQDHCVGACEVEALPTRTRGQQEYEYVALWVVEHVYNGEPVLHLRKDSRELTSQNSSRLVLVESENIAGCLERHAGWL